ncbi:lysoplasmalogenase family protein [Aurantiacibacter poecillastricola]|uniref:lysoplasmalogenase family protein n=1 Tax=Aurantiacibacter poecillastricola TaxID=3064385 RepID=UPI00273D8557|nr:lysoplasmalogenase family protein [Aurantiacibacter sp. 219JJ12-13]MDP5262069.1 lysoplasmalogenase family protein [Aurantiacibacter sp. 219JJ12-13]
MPRRALAEKRPFLLLSVVAALSFYYLQATNLPELFLIPIKGFAVGFLAIYAYLRHGSADSRRLALALGVAAMADMAIEGSRLPVVLLVPDLEVWLPAQFDLIVGGALFFVFHMLAVSVFMQHSRGKLHGRDQWIFLAILMLPPLIGYFLPYDRSFGWMVAIYGVALGLMAASAWMSDFPRMRVAAGALLFVVSDLLLFAELGPLSGSLVPEYLVWPIYYLGQFLITVGVVTTLRKRNPELRMVYRRAD